MPAPLPVSTPGPAAEAPADCPLCPRLVDYRQALRAEYPDWHNNPVDSFGPETAQLLVVGLAPGAKGANRTGRPFTGDHAGDLLYATLSKYGFATGDYAARPADGLQLVDCMVTNAVRCVPPQNKPTGPEINACRPFLEQRIRTMPNLVTIVALGQIAHGAVVRALGGKPRHHRFGHGATGLIGDYTVTASYHCSRYNTNTGVLTTPMFEQIFASVREALSR